MKKDFLCYGLAPCYQKPSRRRSAASIYVMHLNFVQAQPAAPVSTAHNRKTGFLLWAELILARCDSLHWRWWDVPDPKASGDGGSVQTERTSTRQCQTGQVVLHIRTLLLWQRHRAPWSLTTDLRSSLKPLGIRNGIKLTLSPSQA